MQHYTTNPDARTRTLTPHLQDRVTRNFLRLAAVSFALGAQVVMLYDARPSNDNEIDVVVSETRYIANPAERG